MTNDYTPSTIHAYQIPKASGGFRTLYPPPTEDREYQHDIILPILEDVINPLLSTNCYAYRKGVPLHNPILYLKHLLEKEDYKWAVQIDITKFFDNLDRQALYRMLEEIIPKDTLDDIKKTFNVAYSFTDGNLRYKTKGIYQGSPISPILSNLTLSDFDFDPRWNNKDTKIVRYCDDILLFTKGRKKAARALSLAKKYLCGKGFNIIATEPTNLESGYVEFLGFRISIHNKLIDLSPKDNNYIRMIEKLNTCEENELPSKISGWIDYYSLNGRYKEGFYKIQAIVVTHKGREYWTTLNVKDRIPYPNSSNILQ